MPDLIFIAAPDSPKDPDDAFVRIIIIQQRLLAAGLAIHAPAISRHLIKTLVLENPSSKIDWQKIETDALMQCTHLLVLMMEGWQESLIIRWLLVVASEHFIPIRYYDISTHTIMETPL
jgi:hypothetical protein